MKERIDSKFMNMPGYREFIENLKSRVTMARLSASRAVNRDIILLYWDIGRAILENQRTFNWGDSVVEMIADDLKRAFPDVTGFSLANVWRMRQFYALYSSKPILAQAVREFKSSSYKSKFSGLFLEQTVPGKVALQTAPDNKPILAQAVRELTGMVPWGHHVLLLGRIKAASALFYYLQATTRFGWSRNVLLNQIKAGAYERAVTEKKTHNFELALPEHLVEQAEEMLKSSYNLEFLGIRRAVKERVLERPPHLPPAGVYP
jgi:predicted nuclease of restriction endonuclease-like (RecB) superfamily